jgi:hypothetical protein
MVDIQLRRIKKMVNRAIKKDLILEKKLVRLSRENKMLRKKIKGRRR